MAEYTTSIEIEAPPAVVFEHLVEPAKMIMWMGQHAVLDAVVGGTFAVDIGGAMVRGEYVRLDPPSTVVVSWGFAGSDDVPPGSSTVEFTLSATANGTMLNLRHAGLPETRTAIHATGWVHYLDRLATSALGLDPGPDRWHVPRNAEPG